MIAQYDSTQRTQRIKVTISLITLLITNSVTSKLATKWKTSYLLDFWLSIFSANGLQLWLLGTLVYLTLFGLDTVENSWGVNLIYRDVPRNIKSLVRVWSMWFAIYSEYHTLEMVFTRKKAISGTDKESSPRTQHKINICEVRTLSRKFFTHIRFTLVTVVGT